MLELRPMGAEHIPALAKLEKLCFSTPWSEKQINDELENPLAAYYVALLDGQVAGYVGSQSVLGEASVMNIAVHPDLRGRGIARALMGALVDHCLSHGDEKLTLEVRQSNLPALGLYAAFGFEVVGRRKNYYTAPREDALIMTRYFGDKNDEHTGN